MCASKTKDTSKGLTIKNLIRTNKSVSEVKIKIKQKIFQEVVETDLGRYYTCKDKFGETVLHECNIPIETEVVAWFYNGTGLLTLTLNTEMVGVELC